jgi:peptide/nickel transport system ATP-binding protein
MPFRKGFPLITHSTTGQDSDKPLLVVENLRVYYPVRGPLIQKIFQREKLSVHAVDGVSFTLKPGEIFGLVGESGCGKTTTGRAVLRLVDPTSGSIKFEGMNITRLKEERLRPLRTRMQIIFQDPHASLNPAMSIGRAIGHPLKIHGLAWQEEDVKKQVLAAMREVGLTPEEQLYDKYPSDLSGGQKQRAVIARAMILKPKLIVADEPVAMLDMSIRAKVLELMLDLKKKYDLTYLFITHDLATAKFLCDRIAIMYLGRIVETGPAKLIYNDPKHPYTRALLQAIPIPDPRRRARKVLPKGEVPDAVNPPMGCRFHPRCPAVLPTCGWEGKDFLDYLEERRTDLEQGKVDEANLGALDLWKAKGLLAERQCRPENIAVITEYVRSVLNEAPSPLSKAVERVRNVENRLVVQFRNPDPLASKEVEGRLVECLLY